MVSLAIKIMLLIDSKNIDIGNCQPSLFYTYMVSMNSSQYPLLFPSMMLVPFVKYKKCELIRSIN